jgi:hypothetical protein
MTIISIHDLPLPQQDTVYLDFPALGPRQVLASFDGGDISSDGSALLVRQVEQLTGIIRRFVPHLRPFL